MSTPKYIFFLIYFIFHVLFLGGSIYLVNEYGRSWPELNWMIYFALTGLLLFIICVIIVNWQIRASRKKISKQENEINSLKAKIYDHQGQPAATPKPAPSQPVRPDRDNPESGKA